MILKAQLEAQGALLFRWRSFAPAAIIPLVLIAIFLSPDFADGHADIYGRSYDLLCMSISFLGLALRGITVATAAPRTSGRNTREQRADTLNTTGVYSVVRNPLYVANFIVFLGMLLFIKEWWLVVIATMAYIPYYERIVLTEEAYLLNKFGAAYADWAARTPVMIPNFRLWTRPDRPLCLRTLLRREYNGFYVIIVTFYVMEWCDRILFIGGAPRQMTVRQMPGLYWTSFFLGGTIIYFTLRYLKKHTRVLTEPTQA